MTNSPGTLLAVGSLIWLGNNLVFSLLYWEFDSGGARARALRGRTRIRTSRSRSS